MGFSVEKNNRIHEFRFGYGCLRNLGIIWALDGVNEITTKMKGVFSNTSSGGVGFSQVDLLIDIVESSIKDNDGFNRDEWADFLLENPQLLIDLLREFVASMPKPQVNEEPNLGKPPAAKASSKK